MTYANPEERASFIAGLRDLADFLEGEQKVPAPRSAAVMVFPAVGTDSGMREEIDSIAVLIGAGIDDQTADYGHYVTSRSFGPVEYRAVAILTTGRAYHDARRSYADNIRLNADEEA